MILYILCLVRLSIAQTGSTGNTLAVVLASRNLTIFKAYLDKYPSFAQQVSQGNVTSE